METATPQLVRAIRRRAFRCHHDGASLKLLALAEEAETIRFADPLPDPGADEFTQLRREQALAALVDLLEQAAPGATLCAEGLAALLGAVVEG